jgi:TRAP-type mannitol/chloroaromatic compound transport system permease small subunit
MRFLLAYSGWVERVLTHIGMAAGWLFILNVIVICTDVVTRKYGFQFPGLGSTRLQELEWHLHAILFSMWMGLAYLRNAHVRIDLMVARRSLRTRAWIELVCLIIFAVPYCLVLIDHGFTFAWRSWESGEGSESATGLPMRWIAKGLLELGLVMVFVAVTAMMARLIVFLFGPEHLREQARPSHLGS